MAPTASSEEAEPAARPAADWSSRSAEALAAYLMDVTTTEQTAAVTGVAEQEQSAAATGVASQGLPTAAETVQTLLNATSRPPTAAVTAANESAMGVERVQTVVRATEQPPTAPEAEDCHLPRDGEACHAAVHWTRTEGLRQHPEWFKGVREPRSSLQNIQEWYWLVGRHGCGKPCRSQEYDLPSESVVVQSYDSKDAHGADVSADCYDARVGERCHTASLWASTVGLATHPEWYAEVGGRKDIADIQEWFWKNHRHGCQRPCHGADPVDLPADDLLNEMDVEAEEDETHKLESGLEPPAHEKSYDFESSLHPVNEMKAEAEEDETHKLETGLEPPAHEKSYDFESSLLPAAQTEASDVGPAQPGGALSLPEGQSASAPVAPVAPDAIGAGAELAPHAESGATGAPDVEPAPRTEPNATGAPDAEPATRTEPDATGAPIAEPVEPDSTGALETDLAPPPDVIASSWLAPHAEPNATGAPDAEPAPRTEPNATGAPDAEPAPLTEPDATGAPDAEPAPRTEPNATGSPDAEPAPRTEPGATGASDAETAPRTEPNPTGASHAEPVPRTEPNATGAPDAETAPRTKPDATGAPDAETAPRTEPDATGAPDAEPVPRTEPDATGSPDAEPAPRTEPNATGAPDAETAPRTEPDATGAPDAETAPLTEPDATGAPDAEAAPRTEPNATVAPDAEPAADPTPDAKGTPSLQPQVARKDLAWPQEEAPMAPLACRLYCVFYVSASWASKCAWDDCGGCQRCEDERIGTEMEEERQKLADGAAADTARCYDAVKGEPCHRAVEWASGVGVRTHPDWYRSVPAPGRPEDFQEFFWKTRKHGCRRPCRGAPQGSRGGEASTGPAVQEQRPPEGVNVRGATGAQASEEGKDVSEKVPGGPLMACKMWCRFHPASWGAKCMWNDCSVCGRCPIVRTAQEGAAPSQEGEPQEPAGSKGAAPSQEGAVPPLPQSAAAAPSHEGEPQEPARPAGVPPEPASAEPASAESASAAGVPPQPAGAEWDDLKEIRQQQLDAEVNTFPPRGGQSEDSPVAHAAQSQGNSTASTGVEKQTDVIDGYPKFPGCYMRMPTGCPNHYKKTHLWRHDITAEKRNMSESQCQLRKNYWNEYCGVADVKMTFIAEIDKAQEPKDVVDEQLRPRPVAEQRPPEGAQEQLAPAVEQMPSEAAQEQPPAVEQRPPEGAQEEQPPAAEQRPPEASQERAPVAEPWPSEAAKEQTLAEDSPVLQVQTVPLGEVVITRAGYFKDEYLYATQHDDSYGGRFVHTWVNGSLQEDPQARWNISKVGGYYVITHAGSFKNEYLYASRHGDSRGGHFLHTRMQGTLQKEPPPRWNISRVGEDYVIAHAGSVKDEYLCATRHVDPHGWRYVHTLMKGGAPTDPNDLWTITSVAKGPSTAPTPAEEQSQGGEREEPAGAAEEQGPAAEEEAPFFREESASAWGDAATTTPDWTERALIEGPPGALGHEEADAGEEGSWEGVELPDLSAVIRQQGTLHLERYAPSTQEALRRGALTTERRWRASGSELYQSLKEKFTQLPAMKKTASSRCNGSTGDEYLECAWRQYDALLCESLDVAGMQNKLGSLKMVRSIIMSTIQSSLQYGLDWKTRAGMIAKWRDPGWHARGRLDEREFNLMKAGVIGKPVFQQVVNRTCHGLDGVRPRCRELAPRTLFCDALAQAAVAIHSAKDVAQRLEQAAVLREDAGAIVNSSVFDSLDESVRGTLRRGRALNMSSWLRSGSPAETTLRVKFVLSPLFKDRATERCGSVFGDCGLLLASAALCGSLQRAAPSLVTPQLERDVLGSVALAEQGAADVSALIAKFGEESVERDATLREEDEAAALGPELRGLKRRVVSDLRFKAAVSRTCSDLAVVRPGCWDVAPSALFCRAFGRAALEVHGPTRVLEAMLLHVEPA